MTVSDSAGHIIETSLRVAAPDHAPRAADPQLDIPPAEEQYPDAYGLVPFDSRELAPDDGLPPRVTGVYLDGSTWNQFDRDDLAATGRGSATLGYAVPPGSGQLTSFPALADTIHVTFSEGVNVTQGDLAVFGVTTPQYSISAFAYDPATFTATWTLSAAPQRDRLMLDLSDDVTDTSGNALDGEWAPSKEADPVAAFPSGDGFAGGHFRYHFNVLLDDLTGDGTLNNSDLIQISGYYNHSPEGIYHGDVNANSLVNSSDLMLLSPLFGSSLPAVPLPTSLTATAVSDTEIDLSWQPVNGATGYEVQVSDGQTWTALATINDPAASGYSDTGLAPLTHRFYRVRTLKGWAKSDWAAVDATTNAYPNPVVTPTDGAAVEGSTFDDVVATFTDAQPDTLAGEYVATIA